MRSAAEVAVIRRSPSSPARARALAGARPRRQQGHRAAADPDRGAAEPDRRPAARRPRRSQKEIRRLNEVLAEQNASCRRALAGPARPGRGASQTAAAASITERLAELGERLAGGHGARPPPPAPAPARRRRGRRRRAGGARPRRRAAPPPAGRAAPPPRELYSQAYADYARGNYDLAIQGFTGVPADYPDTDFTDNAQYWIGECLLRQAEATPRRSRPGTRCCATIPSSDKLPDARFKKGMALERLGRRQPGPARVPLRGRPLPQLRRRRARRARSSNP